jgi:hypothetical protein
VLLNASLTQFASQQAGETTLTFSTPLSLMTFMVAVPIFWLFQNKIKQISFSTINKNLFATIARQTLGGLPHSSDGTLWFGQVLTFHTSQL